MQIYLFTLDAVFFFHGILSFNIKFMQVSVQFSSVQLLSRVRLFATPWIAARQASLSVHHQLPEFTQTHVHRVGDAIQPSHPLLSPSPPALLFLLGELNFYHYQMILLCFEIEYYSHFHFFFLEQSELSIFFIILSF